MIWVDGGDKTHRNGEVKKRNLSKALYTESEKSKENGWKENEKREVD